MRLPEPLIKGILITRYQRFKADICLEDGTVITAHCPNSGSMMGLLNEGNPVLLSISPNKMRKFPFTWELVHVDRTWVGVNTSIPNRLVYEALSHKKIATLADYNQIKREVRWPPHSRLDFMIKNEAGECYLEVKNVTLVEDGVALFPDAKTDRGRKHIEALMEIVRLGKRGIMFYVVNREDGELFKPADHIDARYGETLRWAYQNGVEILVYQAKINPPFIELARSLPFDLS